MCLDLCVTHVPGLYLNYHRPCGFASIEITARGQRRRRYRAADYRTPYEKLLSLPDWQKHLKDGVRAETLEQQASRHSDTAAAQRIQKAKLALLPLSPWSLIPPDFCSDRSRARGLQTPAPLPRTPIPRCLTATARRTPAAPPFRSSFFRLILGLENAVLHRADLWSQALEAVRTNPPPPGQVSPSGLSTPDTPLSI